jgi:hypothetical protein
MNVLQQKTRGICLDFGLSKLYLSLEVDNPQKHHKH